MENEEVQFGGTLTKKEFYKLNSYVNRKRFFIAIAVYFTLLFLLYLLLFRHLFISIVRAVVFTLVLWLVLMIIVPLRVRKEYSSNQLIKQEVHYDVNRNEIIQMRGKSKVYYKWEDLNSAYEYKDMFRIHISKHQALVIPKRFFESDEDILKFQSLIRISMPEQKVHLSKQQ